MATMPKAKSDVRDLSKLDRMARFGVDGTVIDGIIMKLRPLAKTDPHAGLIIEKLEGIPGDQVQFDSVEWVPGSGLKGLASKITVAVNARQKSQISKELDRARNERATRLIYVFDLAKEAFGDEKLAQKFLARKHPKLRVSPLKKLETEWGGREVEKILNSIIYGLPA